MKTMPSGFCKQKREGSSLQQQAASIVLENRMSRLRTLLIAMNEKVIQFLPS